MSSFENPYAREAKSSDFWIGTAADLDPRQRGNLIELERNLHIQWALGRNFVLAWTPRERGVLLLVVPHYAIAEYAVGSAQGHKGPDSNDHFDELTGTGKEHEFIMRLLAGSRLFTLRQLRNAGRLLNSEPVYIPLRQPLNGDAAEARFINLMVKRYGISYVPSRAVALFDIVEFSLLNSFEQMTQLNSLSHSLNSAHSKMLSSRLNVNFARSSTGDGFYIWNRHVGVEANTNLYHFMHLVLADNAIARSKARGRTVPSLRACFHVGSCYEFHHAEGLNPTIHNEIVGDVTIELARMIDRAMPGQILVGDFHADLPTNEEQDAPTLQLDAVGFMDRAQGNLSRLNGLVLSGDAIESIKCYLTGRACADGTFTIRRLAIADKHGLTHNVFNAKVNIYRRAAAPILLGIEDRLLRSDQITVTTTGHILRPEPPPLI